MSIEQGRIEEKVYKILFTGIGRRVELVQAFRMAALVLKKQLKIYGADMTETAPAFAFCDFTRVVCSMKDERYIDELIHICKQDNIDLLIPTIDTDLLILSQNIEKFETTKVMISSSDMISICRDKELTADFFASCGLDAPKITNKTDGYVVTFPCFIKPRDGSSSINAFRIKNQKEFEMYGNIVENYIIQPFVEGTEYTVDIFCDFSGTPIYITPRKRLKVRAGEVLKTEISLDAQIIEECKKIVKKFKPCGPLTVQLIRDRKGMDYFIEINPRFGGGAPLSMKAGARSPESILQLLSGEEIRMNLVDDGAVYSRFDQSVCIAEGKRNQPIKGVIFDLDDTLYSEKQYVRSGYKAVSDYFGDESVAERLWSYFEEGKPAIDKYLEETGQTDKKEMCLKVYRSHKPEIMLYDGVIELIEYLKNCDIKVGIITDGYQKGQRNKIEALGLDKTIKDIIITDELGGTQFRKPNIAAFQILHDRWEIPYECMIYIGDNAIKDFQAPRQLGMRWIYFDNPDGIYNEKKLDNSFYDISRELIDMIG